MGWFLFGLDRKNRKKGKKLKEPKVKGWDPARTYQWLSIGLTVMVLGGVAAGWGWGQRRLRDAVATRNSMPVEVDLVGLPAWMPRPVSEELKTLVQTTLKPDPFDQESLRLTLEKLRTSPWIASVHHVIRRPGRQVRVLADYRQRAALIRSGPTYHLVDREGVRLPYVYEASEAPQVGLPLIHGVRTARPAPCQPWDSPDLAAGLKLAALIAAQPWFKQVAAIDVSNYNGRLDKRKGHLKISTALDGDEDPFNNPGIEWGRAPGDEKFEAPAAWKLSRVELELLKNKRFNDCIISVMVEPGVTYRLGTQATASGGEQGVLVAPVSTRSTSLR